MRIRLPAMAAVERRRNRRCVFHRRAAAADGEAVGTAGGGARCLGADPRLHRSDEDRPGIDCRGRRGLRKADVTASRKEDAGCGEESLTPRPSRRPKPNPAAARHANAKPDAAPKAAEKPAADGRQARREAGKAQGRGKAQGCRKAETGAQEHELRPSRRIKRPPPRHALKPGFGRPGPPPLINDASITRSRLPSAAALLNTAGNKASRSEENGARKLEGEIPWSASGSSNIRPACPPISM